MKRFILHFTLLCMLIPALLVANRVVAQEKKEITVEWIYSNQSEEVTARPARVWLADGTALLYDYRKPEKERTFERLNPSTGRREPVLDMQKAVASLQNFLGKEKTPGVLPWPTAFDKNGQYAVYLFDDDVIISPCFAFNPPHTHMSRGLSSPSGDTIPLAASLARGRGGCLPYTQSVIYR